MDPASPVHAIVAERPGDGVIGICNYVISFSAPAQAFSWPPGVEREIFNSSSVISAGTSAKSGVLR